LLDARQAAVRPAAAPPLVAPPPLLVDARAAARLCGIGRTLWLQLASAGRVPAPVRLGRRTLWNREELILWCNAKCPGRDRWQAMVDSANRKPRGGA
jgi:predicted DNA-binding transcriptional regulator AlpA